MWTDLYSQVGEVFLKQNLVPFEQYPLRPPARLNQAAKRSKSLALLSFTQSSVNSRESKQEKTAAGQMQIPRALGSPLFQVSGARQQGAALASEAKFKGRVVSNSRGSDVIRRAIPSLDVGTDRRARTRPWMPLPVTSADQSSLDCKPCRCPRFPSSLHPPGLSLEMRSAPGNSKWKCLETGFPLKRRKKTFFGAANKLCKHPSMSVFKFCLRITHSSISGREYVKYHFIILSSLFKGSRVTSVRHKMAQVYVTVCTQ